ncbi:hypothetical protein GCM10009790_24330 [Georgenia ruanii]
MSGSWGLRPDAAASRRDLAAAGATAGRRSRVVAPVEQAQGRPVRPTERPRGRDRPLDAAPRAGYVDRACSEDVFHITETLPEVAA